MRALPCRAAYVLSCPASLPPLPCLPPACQPVVVLVRLLCSVSQFSCQRRTDGRTEEYRPVCVLHRTASLDGGRRGRSSGVLNSSLAALSRRRLLGHFARNGGGGGVCSWGTRMAQLNRTVTAVVAPSHTNSKEYRRHRCPYVCSVISASSRTESGILWQNRTAQQKQESVLLSEAAFQ